VVRYTVMEREHLSLLILFIGVSILLYFVFAPFLSILLLAAVFAIVLHKPYEHLTKAFGGSRSFSAVVVVILTLVLFIVPLLLLGGKIVQEAQSLYPALNNNGAQYLSNVQSAIEQVGQKIVPGFTFDIRSYLNGILIFISSNLGSLAYQTFFIGLETFFMLLAFFFFLRDGGGLFRALVVASPLGTQITREVFGKMYQTIKSVLQGTVISALIRWLCIWAAFYLFHIPDAILWSSIGGIIGAIPGLGTGFAFVPAIAYLYLQGSFVSALGLAVVGCVVVLLVDNMLTAYFFSKGLTVSPVFVLFSILGGIIFFGPLGFIFGPLVLSVFLSIVHVYGLNDQTA
jgi:predicted PurR-regulated permease PerM